MKFGSRVIAIVASVGIAAFALSAFASWQSAIDPLPAGAPQPDFVLLIGLAVTAIGLFSRADSSSRRGPSEGRTSFVGTNAAAGD